MISRTFTRAFRRSFAYTVKLSCEPLAKIRKQPREFSTSANPQTNFSSYKTLDHTPDIFSDIITFKEKPVFFRNMEMAAYFYQIQNDLKKYFGKSPEEAAALASEWAFVQYANRDVVDDGLVTQEEPFYYAANLVLRHVPGWHHYAVRPPDYEYCPDFNAFTAFKKGNEKSKCVLQFNKLLTANNTNEKESANVYHGTVITSLVLLQKGIDTTFGRRNLDFNSAGCGAFYVTKILWQAQKWAQRLAKINTSQAVVCAYGLDSKRVKSLKYKNFADYDEWSEFVIACRRGEKEHDFDFVEGPYIANPWEVFKDEAFPVPDGHQIAVCSAEGAACLEFIGTQS